MKKIITIILCFAMALGLCACGAQSPTDATNDFMKAIKEKDADALKAIYSDGDIDLMKEAKQSDSSGVDAKLDEIYNKELEEKLFDFDYEVSNEKIDGDHATVDVKIKTYGFGTTFTKFMEEYFIQIFNMAMDGKSDDEIDKEATEMLSAKMKDMKKDYEKTITLSLSKKDDKWMVGSVDNNINFYDALAGGLLDSLKSLGNLSDDSSK